MHSVQDNAKTLEEGRPVFIEKPYVRIMVPGDKDNIVQRPVRVNDMERWPKQWQAFENRREQPLEGTPLAEWPGLTRSQCDELAHFGVKTVEALAGMPDSVAQKFMGIQSLKRKAQDYIDAAKSSAPFDQLREENVMLKNELAALKDQFQQMLEDKPKRRTRFRRWPSRSGYARPPTHSRRLTPPTTR
jgi:hypothetical protein